MGNKKDDEVASRRVARKLIGELPVDEDDQFNDESEEESPNPGDKGGDK
ncbi:hypothetical protein KJ840_05780 [Patescibacteria group bacterium]|nr:hypothetical protein [Patescibacteria group bacterium]